jgi:XTP/dITP diphosphohydrolase
MNVVIATHNAKKREELARILGPLGYTIDGAVVSDVEETGVTFEENAVLKAESGCRETGLPCIADDSGLCVDALGGAPGVYSARYAGEHGNDGANSAKLLDALRDVPPGKRTAQFVCAVCCVFPDGREIAVQGTCAGSIAFVPAGDGGFGYDPVFLPDEAPGFTMAQLKASRKDALSHRAKALRALGDRLMQESGIRIQEAGSL